MFNIIRTELEYILNVNILYSVWNTQKKNNEIWQSTSCVAEDISRARELHRSLISPLDDRLDCPKMTDVRYFTICNAGKKMHCKFHSECNE